MEAASPIKHEFLDGEVFAMAGAKPDHNQTASAALVALGPLLRGGRCRAFSSDQRIFIVETGLYTYADGGVACGRWQIHADGMCLLNPALVFEVLSPSTRDYDRGAKLEHYRRIPSLRHVLLIDQPDRCVEHHRRREGGAVDDGRGARRRPRPHRPGRRGRARRDLPAGRALSVLAATPMLAVELPQHRQGHGRAPWRRHPERSLRGARYARRPTSRARRTRRGSSRASAAPKPVPVPKESVAGDAVTRPAALPK